MGKRPMTTGELFEQVSAILKEKNLMPEILDYSLGSIQAESLTNYEFNVRSNLGYGGNEGIYLHLWLECRESGRTCKKEFGTFKTLDNSDEAMHVMAKLLADFIIEESRYVNANLDDFTWEGANVYPIDESGKKSAWGYSCETMERALKQKDRLIQKYGKVVIRDNATRKKTIYERA